MISGRKKMNLLVGSTPSQKISSDRAVMPERLWFKGERSCQVVKWTSSLWLFRSYQRGEVSQGKSSFLTHFSLQGHERWNWPRTWPAELHCAHKHKQLHCIHTSSLEKPIKKFMKKHMQRSHYKLAPCIRHTHKAKKCIPPFLEGGGCSASAEWEK